MNKSFWNRAEGFTGIIFIGLLLFVLYWYFPQMLLLLTNTYTAIGFFAVISGLVYVLIDSNLRNQAWEGFKSLMRSITALFIQLENTKSLEPLIKKLEINLHALENSATAIQNKINLLKDSAELQAIKNPNKSIIFKSQKGNKQKTLKIQYFLDKLDTLHTLVYQKGENSVALYRELKDKMEEDNEEKEIRKIVETNFSEVEALQNFVKVADDFLQSLNLTNKSYDDKKLIAIEKYFNVATKKATPNTPKESPQIKNTHQTPKKDDGNNKYKDLFKF